VFNERGEIIALCAISESVRPGVASIPFGGVVDEAGVRRHINCLTPEEATDWGGGSGFYDTFVDVERSPVDLAN
jgi:anaerobic selenocysteine-containing dehydrogenase